MDVKTYILYERLLNQQAELASAVRELEVKEVLFTLMFDLEQHLICFRNFTANVTDVSRAGWKTEGNLAS
jgi:hypothetical protein